MKLKMKAILTAGAVLAMPAVVHAQAITPFQGFYVGFGGGADWAIGSTSGASTWTGWAVGGKAGYDFVGPRVELEVGYGQIPTSANIPGTAINGKIGQLTAMANRLYDFCPSSVVTPYIGAGAGVAFVDSNASLGSTQFAYQGMIGLAYNVSDSLRFMVEGRYVGTTKPSVNTPIGTVTFRARTSWRWLACSSSSCAQRCPPPAAAGGCAAVLHGVLRPGPLEPCRPGAEHDRLLPRPSSRR